MQANIILSGNVVGAIQFEYTTNGMVWKVERTEAGTLMQYTGTVGTPLSGDACHEFVKNESGKDRVYRWRCTSYTSGDLYAYLYKQRLNLNSWLVPNSQDLWILWDGTEPTSGSDGDGAGYAGHGSLFIDTSTDGRIYYNQSTATMTNWATV